MHMPSVEHTAGHRELCDAASPPLRRREFSNAGTFIALKRRYVTLARAAFAPLFAGSRTGARRTGAGADLRMQATGQSRDRGGHPRSDSGQAVPRRLAPEDGTGLAHVLAI